MLYLSNAPLMTPFRKNKMLSLNVPFEYIHALNEWPPFSPINDHLLICTQYLFGEGFIFALRLRASLYDPFFFLKTEGFTKRPPSFYSPHQMIPLFFLCPHWKTPFFLYIACHRKTPTLRVLSAHPRHFHMWVPPGGSEKAPFTISAGGASPPDPHQGALHPGPPRYLRSLTIYPSNPYPPLL